MSDSTQHQGPGWRRSEHVQSDGLCQSTYTNLNNGVALKQEIYLNGRTGAGGGSLSGRRGLDLRPQIMGSEKQAKPSTLGQ
jgi:hypothetical protein